MAENFEPLLQDFEKLEEIQESDPNSPSKDTSEKNPKWDILRTKKSNKIKSNFSKSVNVNFAVSSNDFLPQEISETQKKRREERESKGKSNFCRVFSENKLDSYAELPLNPTENVVSHGNGKGKEKVGEKCETEGGEGERDGISNEEEEEWSHIDKAACLVEQAMKGRRMPLEVVNNLDPKKSRKAYNLYHFMGYIRKSIIVIFMIIPVFEVPPWCDHKLELPCGDPQVVPLSGVFYWPPEAVLLLDVVNLIFLTFFIFLQFQYLGSNAFWKNHVCIYKVTLISIGILDLFFSFLKILEIFPTFQISIFPYLRIFLAILFSRSLRGSFRILLRIFATFLDVTILCALFVVFFSWLGFLLFQNSPQGEKIFESFPKTLKQMFILLTTANNPNIWVPAFSFFRPSFFFFFVYVSVGLYFLMNLLVSVIYGSYKVQLAARREKNYTARKNSLMSAFSLLDFSNQGWISPSIMSSLFLSMDRYKEVPTLRNRAVEIFLALDQRRDFKIWRDEFERFCDVVGEDIDNMEQKPSKKMIFLAKTLTLTESQIDSMIGKRNSVMGFLKKLVLNFWFEKVVFGSLGFALAVVAIESVIDEPLRPFLLYAEITIGLIWVAEVAVKILAFGIRNFWKKTINKFDFFIVFIIFAVTISSFFRIEGFHNFLSIRYPLIFRSFRLVALSAHIPRWHIIRQTSFVLLPVLLPVLGLQFSICSLFSLVGVHIFGGQINTENQSLVGTEYLENGFLLFNYNDFGLAMVTSFNLCVVNNWYIIMDGFVASSGTNWAISFFVLFYIIAAVFGLNVVVAFGIEVFLNEISARTDEEEKEKEKEKDKFVVRNIRSSLQREKSLAPGFQKLGSLKIVNSGFYTP